MNMIQINTLGYLVDRTFSNMVKFLNYELLAKGLDFQHPQFIILMILSKYDGLSQTELTTFIDRDKGSVSRNITYLESKGYIIRRMEGGKKKIIYLTEKGKSIIPILYDISDNNMNTSLKGFSEKNKKAIFEMLRKMSDNVSIELEKANT